MRASCKIRCLRLAVFRRPADRRQAACIGVADWLEGTGDTKRHHAILEEAERGEDAAVKNYRAALLKDFLVDIHQEVDRQYKVILATQ